MSTTENELTSSGTLAETDDVQTEAGVAPDDTELQRHWPAAGRALPGKMIDLIRDGVPDSDLKKPGRAAVWSALIKTAMSAQYRGWDQVEWEQLILEPRSYLGYQARCKGKDRTLPAMQVAKQFDNAWERAWELRTARDAAWTPAQARAEALERAELASRAVENPDVNLSRAERAVLAHVIEQTRQRGFTNVALPRRAIYAATGLGSTATTNALTGLKAKGLLFLHQAGQNAKGVKYRRASIYGLPDVRALHSYLDELILPSNPSPHDQHSVEDRLNCG